MRTERIPYADVHEGDTIVLVGWTGARSLATVREEPHYDGVMLRVPVSHPALGDTESLVVWSHDDVEVVR